MPGNGPKERISVPSEKEALTPPQTNGFGKKNSNGGISQERQQIRLRPKLG